MRYRLMVKELTLEERKQIQLDMLTEIDAFCREHNIKYALSCGTLIGAIRHKGFIPWDDDVDITMPYDDMLMLKKTFHSSRLKVTDAENTPGYSFPFPRISDQNTYSKKGIIAKGSGVSIDVYPIIECSSDPKITDCIIEKGVIINKQRKKAITKYNRIFKCLPIPLMKLGFHYQIIKEYNDFLIDSLRKSGQGSFYQIGGPLTIFYKNLWNFNPFEELIDVEFEGLLFPAPKKFHEFLTVRYGDYMQLPPEQDRQAHHASGYYKK